MSAQKATLPRTEVNSWGFWRKRLARALIVGALVLLATQVLPSLPQDQRVLVIAPEKAHLEELKLSYFQPGDSEALGGIHLQLPGPVDRVPHSLRLPAGTYRIEVRASGENREGESIHWVEEHTLELTGGTAQLFLKASQP